MKTKKILVILGSIFVVLALVYVYHINSVTREGGQGFSRNPPRGVSFRQSFDPDTHGYVAPPNEVNRADLSEETGVGGDVFPAVERTPNTLYTGPTRSTRANVWKGGVGSGQGQEGQRATEPTDTTTLRAAPKPGTVKYAQDNIYDMSPPSFMGESAPGDYAVPRVVRPGQQGQQGQQYDSVLTQPDVQTAEAASNMGTGVRTARSAVYGGTDAPGPGVYVGGSAPREGTYSQAEPFE